MGKIDLARLTREQKLLLVDLLEEKHRRAREKKALYTPNPGQLPVHQSSKHERWVFSGNGAGKTALCTQEALWAVSGYNPIRNEFTPVPVRGIIVLDHPEKVTDVYLPEFQKWSILKPEQLHKRGKPYVSSITFPNGSEIIFLFHGMEQLAFESIEAQFVIFDEPPPRNVFVGLKRSMRTKGSKPWLLGVGTPITGSWLRQEVYEPWVNGERPDVECFRFGTTVNETNLADGYIEQFSKALTEKERRIRLEGEFFDLEGMALAHLFSRQVHIVDHFEWPHEYPVVVAIDPHPSKAHYAIMLGVSKDNDLFVLRELKAKLVPREFAKYLKDWMAPYRVVDIVCDSLGSSEMTGGEGFKSFIQVLNDSGVRARATNWDEKNDEAFISRMQEALVIPKEPDLMGRTTPKLRIVRGCDGIVRDIENVQFTKYRNVDEYKPKLDITNKDYLSCLKYALAANPVFQKAKAHAYAPTKMPSSYGVSSKPRGVTLDSLTKYLSGKPK
jgi:hypothetical protein